jgi:hypothetical protein
MFFTNNIFCILFSYSVIQSFNHSVIQSLTKSVSKTDTMCSKTDTILQMKKEYYAQFQSLKNLA